MLHVTFASISCKLFVTRLKLKNIYLSNLYYNDLSNRVLMSGYGVVFIEYDKRLITL